MLKASVIRFMFINILTNKLNKEIRALCRTWNRAKVPLTLINFVDLVPVTVLKYHSIYRRPLSTSLDKPFATQFIRLKDALEISVAKRQAN